jgi:uncharacterized protein (DUF305 family)
MPLYALTSPNAASGLHRAVHLGRRRLLTALALAVLTGCAGASRSTSASAAPYPVGAMGEEAAVARARADSLRWPYTEADVTFMSTMIHHHAQAIEMAKLAPSHGASPAVIRLSERIINAQNDEIALMQRWLRDRHRPAPEPNPNGAPMKMDGMDHVMLMPGMLTEPQMKELAAAQGDEFDRLFLTFMIQHHRGAVSMVKELFANHGAGQDETVFKFASDVNVDQTTEINRMLQMLLSLGAKPPAR